MSQFHIYHSTGPNKFEEVDNQPREYAGFVEANTLDEVYTKSQNFDEPWNTSQPCRSTSVGDVIYSKKGIYMVKGMGFKTLVLFDQEEPIEGDFVPKVEYPQ